MNLAVQCAFADVYNAFRENKYDLSTVSEVIVQICHHSNEISDEAKRTLLEIPRYVLNHQIELDDEQKWVSENASYFFGNAQKDAYAEIFDKGEFDLDTIRKYLDYILGDSERLNKSFKLRNIEVTIRDYASPAGLSGFGRDGFIFARTMEKAFDL